MPQNDDVRFTSLHLNLPPPPLTVPNLLPNFNFLTLPKLLPNFTFPKLTNPVQLFANRSLLCSASLSLSQPSGSGSGSGSVLVLGSGSLSLSQSANNDVAKPSGSDSGSGSGSRSRSGSGSGWGWGSLSFSQSANNDVAKPSGSGSGSLSQSANNDVVRASGSGSSSGPGSGSGSSSDSGSGSGSLSKSANNDVKKSSGSGWGWGWGSLPFCQSANNDVEKPSGLGSFWASLSQSANNDVVKPSGSGLGSGSGVSGEERVLISEVWVRNKDGEELERKDLEGEAMKVLKACRPSNALTSKEVQEDVHRIMATGYFCSCLPVAVDTRDGIRIEFQVEPNQEFQGLVCEGANVLPAKFVEDAFRDGYGKVVNIRRLDDIISSINGWYMERGLFGMVSGIEILSGGMIRLQVSEAEVNNIGIRFVDKTGEPTVGKTRPETILRQLTTKMGQVYSMLQGKRDVDTVLTMGIMDDVSIVPQPAGDNSKVDLTMNVVERKSGGGVSAGGGISSGITSGPLAGLIGSCAIYHKNLFGRNQKLNLSLERGQIDSLFRINYTDPWIEGDDKRTSRTIMVQNSRSPGALIHGNQPDDSSLTIGRVTGGIEFSRPFRPKWNGTAGLTFQRAGARDDKGNLIIRDYFSSPLTASGNTHDDMLIAKLETVYTGSGEPGSSMFVFNMDQGIPLFPEWLAFNRVNARCRKVMNIGPASVLLSLSGGHVLGNFPPHEAFALGGTNSIRGYEEGMVGSGRSFVVGCGEVSFPLIGPVEGAIFADYGTDLGSGPTVPGDPAGARRKPGSGYGYGVGIRVESPLGPLRLEYALNEQKTGRFHFGVGLRN